jgi:hypothetical protein
MFGSWSRHQFPNINKNNSKITSPATRVYNCAAWAAKENHRRWDPTDPQYYWPHGVPRENTLDAFVQAYKTIGYKPCFDGSYEPGFQKIAIYAKIRADNELIPKHVALQLETAEWTSKVGDHEDIIHSSLNVFDGAAYGQAVCFLKKQTIK